MHFYKNLIGMLEDFSNLKADTCANSTLWFPDGFAYFVQMSNCHEEIIAQHPKANL